MALPSINSLVRYINRKLSGTNWNANWQKVVNWLADGTTDLNVNNITIATDLNVGGDVNVTGNVTATKFIGDGSDITGLNGWRKNFIINGTTLIKSNADYTLVNNVYGTSVDRFDGMATGTAISAGTLTQTVSASCGTTGYAIKFSGATITGTGVLYLRHRLYSKDAVNFKNKVASFSMQCYHDVGSSIPYTIYINKASVLNNFTSVVAIDDSGGRNVASSLDTQLKFESVSMGDCTNGIEILIKVECGAVTLKNFEFTQLQLELNNNASEFEYRPVNYDIALNNYDNVTNNLNVGNIVSSGNITGTIPYVWRRFYSYTAPVGSTDTSISITGLDGNIDKQYRIVINMKFNTVLGPRYLLVKFNDITTTTQYNSLYTYITGSGTVVTLAPTGLQGDIIGVQIPVGGVGVDYVFLSETIISCFYDSSSKDVCLLTNFGALGGGTGNIISDWYNNSNLTKMTIYSPDGLVFKEGTTIDVYKRS
jgi:hypothetical protein